MELLDGVLRNLKYVHGIGCYDILCTTKRQRESIGMKSEKMRRMRKSESVVRENLLLREYALSIVRVLSVCLIEWLTCPVVKFYHLKGL